MSIFVRLIVSGEELMSEIVADSAGVFRFDVEYLLTDEMVDII